MHEISNQHYLGKSGETVQVDSQTEGGTLSLFLDGVPQGPAFNFNLPAVPGTRLVQALYTAPSGKKAGVRVRTVTNRPNDQDITILVIPSGANHTSKTLTFDSSDDANLLSLLAPANATPGATKKAAKKATKKATKKGVKKNA